jgi:hypothetical protein
MTTRDRYQILSIHDPSLKEYLEQISGPISLDKRHVLTHVVEYVRDVLKCKRVIVEKEYIDVDYASEYAVLYSRCFKKFGNICNRLHFFARDVTLEDLRNGAVEEQTYGYRGYCVLTPLVCGTVGRTVLSPWPLDEEMATRHQMAKFCVGDFRAHVYGRTLLVSGAPFIEQDSMVMACAQASVWMAAFLMHGKYGQYGISRHLPGDITEAAGRYLPWWGRTLPSEGLLVSHMVNALANMGYSPVLRLRQAVGWTDPLSLIQKYIDSNIPVIATLSRPSHAVTVIGYVTCKDRRGVPGEEPSFLYSDRWISALIVNDDQCGPYRIMPTSNAFYEMFKHLPKKNLLPVANWWATSEFIDGLIIPLPREVNIQASHIGPILEELFSIVPPARPLQLLIKCQREKPNPYIRSFLGCLLRQGSERIVARCYLTRAVHYLNSIEGRMSRAAVELYQTFDWPQYLWVAELIRSSEFDSKDPTEREVIGEVIFDSTGNRYAPSHLCIHFPGIVIRRNPHTEQDSMVELWGDGPYKSLM